MTPLAAALAAFLVAVTYGVAGEFAAPGVAILVAAAATFLAPPGSPERGRGAFRGADRPPPAPHNPGPTLARPRVVGGPTRGDCRRSSRGEDPNP